MEELFTWAQAQGISCSLVAPDACNRGLLAARAILPGEAFVTIPQRLLLNADLCHQDPVYGHAFSQLKKEAGADIDSRHLLCLLLIVERAKGEASLWQPYIQYLPETYDDPLWWGEKEVALLWGTRLEIAVKQHRKIAAKLTCWRDQLVQLQRSADNKEGAKVLQEADGGWALSDKAILWAKSTGCALHSNYGNKSNEELILGYGFAVPHNEADFFHVMVGLAGSSNPKPEGSSNAVPDEVVVQRRALLQRLGLSTSHYLKLQEPQGLGQAAQVDLEPLLNTAAICLMPDQWAYHWWQAPAAAKQLSPPRSLATGTRRATQPNAVDNIGSQAVPGLVEVKASAGVAHAERRVDNAAAERGLPLPVAFSETAASVSASTAPSAQEPVATSAPQPSPSPAADRSVRNSNDGSPFGCSPLHVQMQVLKSLRHLLTAKLDAIAGGSAKEDQLLAKQPGCSQAAVMALEYRAGQKDIASAALTSLAQKGTETVCLAAARLPAESSWVSTEGQVDAAEQEPLWWSKLGVQCNKLRERRLPLHAVTLPSPPDSLPNTETTNMPVACQHGVVTTATIRSGKLLISIPQHAVVAIDQPEQLTVQLASMVYDQALHWHIKLNSNTQPLASSPQQVEGIFKADDHQEAQSVSQEQLLGSLVDHWGPSGIVALGLPARLLLAQLWPHHETSQLATDLPEVLAGVVIDVVWDKDTRSLHALAACNLPASMPLTSGLTAVGADPEHLIMTHGPEMLAWAQQSMQGQGHALLPWQAPDAASFQLCIEPAEEDELRNSKLELLLASALGTTHALTATSSQERLLAALAVCGCGATQLEQLGAADLLSAFHQSNNTARQDSDSVASSVQQDLLDKAEHQLQHQQDAFVTELLRPQSALQVAQQTLGSLLEAERMQLVSDDTNALNDNLAHIIHQSCMRSLQQYQQELVHILGHHLCQTQVQGKQRKRKKGHSSRRDKHQHMQE
ncbi:MAG: Histone-lysine N-methyltransferase setd3 [Trebouxia sp. A1-2]|nr:MAG: Histone-lysine N-methyltransferase setd3 [Trebouxia sp. A1-2]